MSLVNLIFAKGPQAVADFFAGDTSPLDELDLKQLADISWTRASSIGKSDPDQARLWGRAALTGYEFLSRRAKPAVARSAGENAAALRTWKLLTG